MLVGVKAVTLDSGKPRASPLPSVSATLSLLLTLLFLNFLYLSTFYLFWLCWIFVALHRLSLVVARVGYSALWCEDLIAVASLVTEPRI